MNEPLWFCCPQDQTTKFILTFCIPDRISLTEDKEWRMKKSSISCSQKTFEWNSPSLLQPTKAFRNSICILCWQLKNTGIEISDPHRSHTAARIKAFAFFQRASQRCEIGRKEAERFRLEKNERASCML